jgi:hypothetical protein
VAFADLRRTGFEDVFEEMGGAQPGDAYQSTLYANPGTSKNHWITLKAIGVKSNRAAFGVRVELRIEVKKGAFSSIYRTIGYGSSFGGNPLEQHIGIGPAMKVAEVIVTWPTTGVVDRVRNVPADRRYTLREGAGKLEPMFVAQH